jgi:DNA-binding transcriptional MocR family regulator
MKKIALPAPKFSAPRSRNQVFRYRQLAAEIERRIFEGVYQPGEKLPSIRRLHRQSHLSISTVYQAYRELEDTGIIESRPKSGYFVLPVSLKTLEAPVFRKKASIPQKIYLAPVINSVVSAISNPRFIPLGNTGMDPALVPAKALARILKSLNQADLRALLSYSPSEGLPDLRRQIALQSVGTLEKILPEDIVITNGCTEAVALSLLAVTRPGDTVAIETPTNLAFLQLLQELGLLVAEVPTDPKEGLDLNELERCLHGNPIKACLLMPNFQNPLGALMPDGKKQELVKLARRHEIPVIEDDISSQLYFGDQCPVPLRAFDRDGLVMTCSSFSKTLSPGLRLGWIIPGKRYLEKIKRLKAGTTICTSTLDQYLAASFLASGAYERHLRVLRDALKKQTFLTAFAIQSHFPQQTRLAVPRGGSLLWVELPAGVDGLEVYRRAFEQRIAIIPGGVCANSKQFRNFIQISCAMPFGPKVRAALGTLGAIVSELAYLSLK